MRFEDYWENYGELHASMCGGDIKQFAKEIWMSANVYTEELKDAAFAVATALNGYKDFENNDAHEGNYLQVIRKLASDYKRAINEIAESHSVEEVEVDGTMCFTVTCGCEFCEQWRMLNDHE